MMKIKPLFFAIPIIISGSLFASATQKIVSFQPAVSAAERIKSVESLHGKVTREFHIVDALVAVFPDNVKDSQIYSLVGVVKVDDDKYLKWIEETPFILSLSSVDIALKQLKVSDFQISETIPVPTVPNISDEEKEIPWGVKRVNAAAAWPVTMGAGIKVAVIDTGIDYSHPDLQANYGGGYNAIISTTPPLDDHGHGTHVAGTIAAVRDFKGVVGVAPKTMLYGVKVLDNTGSGYISWIISGIEWAVDNNVDVMNMSLGSPNSVDSLAQAVTAAYKKGITIICAAGNTSGSVIYPAKYPESIAVSASDSSDKIASFSSRGPEIDFIAPGVMVYSTYYGSSYATMSGTSMASPHVAGLASLAVSLGADTPAKVKEALIKAAVSINLKPDEEGAGLINAGKLGSPQKTEKNTR
ncbi:MAG: S8 family peptidase [Elusimicrobia bacterium]|nr:S8 family peptidase [Elusimicrobiota bacterium]